MDLYRLRRKHTGLCSYGHDRYAPFPAIVPTSDVVDCYANIVLPAPPVVTDNCGVTLTPAGPVETGSVVCEGDYTYTWTYTDCEVTHRIMFIRSRWNMPHSRL
jgi:hypothetical protein